MMKKSLAVSLSVTLFLLLAAAAYQLPVEGITPINDRDYAPAVMRLIDAARDNIKVMLYQARYYDEFPGSFSNDLADGLVRARKRGVSVTAIVERADWNADNTKWNEHFAKKLAAGGVEVYLDPMNITSHQKVMLVDDEVTVVGSANWSHYSLTRNNEASVAVWSQDVNKAFQQYFNQRLAESILYEGSLTTPTLAKRFTPFFPMLPTSDVKLLANRDYFPGVHEAFSAAKNRICVIQMEAFYYMTPPKPPGGEAKPIEPASQVPGAENPTKQLLRDLADAKNRGVDVKVILDVQSGQRNANEDFANRLLARGVDVYYDSPSTTTHAKMILVDDDTTILGSTNWSFPAIALGNEASVLIKSRDVNRTYFQYFERVLRSSRSVRDWKPEPVTTPNRSAAQSAKAEE
jgi:phosphatidylserine/phosphatidylglycerophosphate/cardiolipin synthase-like enzyme